MITKITELKKQIKTYFIRSLIVENVIQIKSGLKNFVNVSVES